jgi:hypothetical protein
VPSTELDRPQIDLAEAITLGLVALVACTAVEAYVLAVLGVHHFGTVMGALAVTAVVVGLLVRRRAPTFARPSMRSLLPLAPAVLAVGLLSFPGFHYATGDKDPGIYVLHATSIADTGKLTIDKSALQMSGALTEQDVPGAQWRGFDDHYSATEVIPSFFHLWPSLLAVGFEAVGFRAILVVLPLIGLVSTLAMYFLARRLGGTIAAVVASLLLATNMMQVWQSRYPTSEVLGQMLFVGSALAMVIALQTKWRAAALLAGMLATAGFINRGEGIAVVLAFGGLLALGVASESTDRVCRWAALGIAIPLPIAWMQAYGLAASYAAANSVPGPKKVAAVLLLELVLAVALATIPAVRELLHKIVRPFVSEDGDARRPVKLALIALVLALTMFGVFRPMFGFDYFGYRNSQIRSYDERSLWRLALFFTWVGIALAVGGAVAGLWTRWKRERIALYAVLLVFTVLFLFHAKNSPQMMWWGRRFVPLVVPGLVLMAAIGVGASLQRLRRNGPLYIVLLLVVAGVMGIQARQSFALRGHDEKAGSYGVAQSVGALAGPQRGVFLWQRGPCCSGAQLLFGSSTWILSHNDSGVLPTDPLGWAKYAESIRAAVPNQPVFLVLKAGTEPPTSSASVFTMTERFTGSLPVWEESNKTRPSHALTIPYDLVVYKMTPAS